MKKILTISLSAVLTLAMTFSVPASEAENNRILIDGADIEITLPVIYQDGNMTWAFDLSELKAEGGILFQMLDDASNAESDPDELYHMEEAGFPTESRVSEDIQKEDGREVVLDFINGEYTGDIFNATGYYYDQAADALTVKIESASILNGDIALTSYVHGTWKNDESIEELIAAAGLQPEDTEYVLLDTKGELTDKADDAAAIQFTKYSAENADIETQVLNLLNVNGQAFLDVYVEGTWKVEELSLITYLNVDENAHVYGAVTEMTDGSLVIVPSEEELAAGEYGESITAKEKEQL